MSSAIQLTSTQLNKLMQLVELRKLNDVTQLQATEFFGNKDRDTYGRWERGKEIPSEQKYRGIFLKFFWEKLKLRRYQEKFEAIWNEIAIDVWNWNQLSRQELSGDFSSGTNQTFVISEFATRAVFLTPLPNVHKIFGRGRIGREIRNLILRQQHVALTGLPGVGKTALANQLAHDGLIKERFRDGILWARLGKNPDVIGELSKWASALGISLNRIEDKTKIVNWVDVIQSALNTRQMLLILDDAWSQETVNALMLGGPECVRLLTTRFASIAVSSGIDEFITIGELAVDDGVSLIDHLAPQATVVEPDECRHLVTCVGALPLALTLIGNYLRRVAANDNSKSHQIRLALSKLHAAEYRLRLSESQILAQRHPSLPAHTEISLEAVIDVSYEALSDLGQYALGTLSLFPPKSSSFSDEAARYVSGQQEQTFQELIGFGLVERIGDRYTIHQTIHDYASMRLSDIGPVLRLADYYQRFLQTFENDYNLLDLDEKNVRAAIDAAFRISTYVPAINIVNHFMAYLFARGMLEAAKTLLENAQGAAPYSTNMAYLMLNQARLMERQGKYSEALKICSEIMQLAIHLEEDALICDVHLVYGNANDFLGDTSAAQRFYKAGLAIARDLRDTKRIIKFLFNLGAALVDTGEYEDATLYLDEGIKLAKKSKRNENLGTLLLNRGAVAGSKGMLLEEERYYKEAYLIQSQIGAVESMIFPLTNLGAIELDRYDYQKAEEYFQQAFVLATKAGLIERVAALHNRLGMAARHMGKMKLAKQHLEEGLSISRSISHQRNISVALIELGKLTTLTDELEEADKLLREGIAQARSCNYHWYSIIGLCYLGDFYVKQNQSEQAQITFEEALSQSKALGLTDQIGEALMCLARLAFAQRQYSTAENYAKECSTIFTEQHPKHAESRELLRLIDMVKSNKEDHRQNPV